MKQPLFPSTISTRSRFAYFLTVKAVVRKFGKSDGQTRTWCLDKAVLAQGGGGDMFKGLPMYGDLLLDQISVNFLGPAPLDLELLHMLAIQSAQRL